VAGVRRSASGRAGTSGEPIDLLDDDEDDVEVLGESSSASANGGSAPVRRNKRSRVDPATGGADDVIVIDD